MKLKTVAWAAVFNTRHADKIDPYWLRQHKEILIIILNNAGFKPEDYRIVKVRIEEIREK